MMKGSRLENNDIDRMLLTSIDKLSLECYIEVHEECKENSCSCICHH
ncbi:MAG: hypothetical protein KatS3mg003_2204 [Candidatus Nitrosocaldaceae archaeon]|nr:MAG: hypothetical protein KatS3mg003_0002 [Candidatus Nitrosocaldaceae archaeon]GIU72725.1 MAG: hypothetical protein KatS3mg003_2204 [Candidatus Nitrosocaldaceae archaeon]